MRLTVCGESHMVWDMRSRNSEELQSCAMGLQTGVRRRLVAFPHGVEQSTPMNGSPYLTALPMFERMFGHGEWRRAMLDSAKTVAARLLSSGFEPLFAIVGGSFLNFERAEPRDLDIAIFYQLGEQLSGERLDLRGLEQEYLEQGLDLRLFPYDANPALVAKLIGYLSMLYVGPERAGPIVIVDLIESRASLAGFAKSASVLPASQAANGRGRVGEAQPHVAV
jgi:hypothetical protein